MYKGFYKIQSPTYVQVHTHAYMHIEMVIIATQDKVWGYALLINGLFFVFMVYRVGGERYRKEIVNKVSMHVL